MVWVRNRIVVSARAMLGVAESVLSDIVHRNRDIGAGCPIRQECCVWLANVPNTAGAFIRRVTHTPPPLVGVTRLRHTKPVFS